MNLSQTLAKLSDPTKELNETRRNSFTLRTQRDLPVRPSRESPRKTNSIFFYFFDGFSSILLLFIVFLAIEANLNTNQISSSITYSLFSEGRSILSFIFSCWPERLRLKPIQHQLLSDLQIQSPLQHPESRGMSFYSKLLISFLWYVLIKCDMGAFSRYLISCLFICSFTCFPRK